jgi:hypothetical protein
LTQSKLDNLVAVFAKLAVERIDTVREAAGIGLAEIARAPASDGRPFMKGRELLSEILAE